MIFLSIYYDLCNRIKLLLNETLSARLAGFLPLILQWGFPLLLLIWFPYSCLRIWEFPIHKSPCGLPLLWHLGHLNFYGVLFLEMYRTKKFFVLVTELLSGVLFGIVAFSLFFDYFFAISISTMAIIAFSGATHDI